MADAIGGEIDAGLALPGDEVLELRRIGDTDIEVAVGHQHDPVDSILVEVLLGQIVGQRQPGAARGRAAGMKRLDRAAHRQFLIACRRRQHGAGRAGIDHHRNAVLRPQPVDQHVQRLAHQRQLVGRLHRARHVDQENEVRRWLVARRDVVALKPDMDDFLARRPGRGRHRDVRLERLVRRGRTLIAVVEIVEQLLHTHRVARRQRAVSEEAAHIGVGGGIDVDGEGRDRLLADALHRIGRRVRVFLGVEIWLLHRHGRGGSGKSVRHRRRRRRHLLVGAGRDAAGAQPAHALPERIVLVPLRRKAKVGTNCRRRPPVVDGRVGGRQSRHRCQRA